MLQIKVLLSGCVIVLFLNTIKLVWSKQCGNEKFPLQCPEKAFCVAISTIKVDKFQLEFRCDLQGWCLQRCPKVPLSHDWCLLRNSTHDIKCCPKDHCNWEDMPLFAMPKEKPDFIRGTRIIAEVFIPIIIIIFIIYPIASALYCDWANTNYAEIEYNPSFDSDLPEIEGIIFKNTVPKVGEPLDGCLNMDEFTDVMKTMAEHHGTEDNKTVVTPKESINYTDYEVHESLGFDYAVIIRMQPTKFESLLIRMIEQGPGFFDLDGAELYELLAEVSEVFRTENSLLEVPADIVVIGEIRGRYSDLLRWFQLYGYPPKRRYLFLGGIIDQQCAESIETFAFLSAYKITTPHHIYIIRGATEFFPFQIYKRFPRKLSIVLSSFVMRICSEMPIAATIGNKILAIHSGISSKLKSLDAIRKIDRPPLKWNCQIPYDLMFGMPSAKIDMYERIKGGRGHFFGAKAVEECAERLQVVLILRTHTPYEKGHFTFASRRLLTIWSGNCNNVKLATSIYIDANLRITIHSMTPVVVKTITSVQQMAHLGTQEELIEVEDKNKLEILK